MAIRVLNILLLVLLVVMMGVIFFVRRDYTTRNVELLPGMVSYVAYRPQAPTPLSVDRSPIVEGTVVHGFERFPYRATPEDAARAGLELSSPLHPKDSTADRQRGAEVFATMCKPCHGAGGAGDGTVAQRGFPPPPSLLADNARKIKDGQIYHIITLGQRNMPGLAAQVTRLDRWRVIEYVRSLQRQSIPTAGGSR